MWSLFTIDIFIDLGLGLGPHQETQIQFWTELSQGFLCRSHLSSSATFLSLLILSTSASLSAAVNLSTSAWDFPESSLFRATSCSSSLRRSLKSGHFLPESGSLFWIWFWQKWEEEENEFLLLLPSDGCGEVNLYLYSIMCHVYCHPVFGYTYCHSCPQIFILSTHWKSMRVTFLFKKWPFGWK